MAFFVPVVPKFGQWGIILLNFANTNKKTIISKRQEYENRIDENLGSWLGAAELENLIVKGGDIPLLPSSRNYDWFTTKEVAADVLCYGEVFTMGRARHANTKYVKGYFVSANNMIENKRKQKSN